MSRTLSINYVPKGETVNFFCIRTALATFLQVFQEKRPIMSSQDWWLRWDNAPVHKAPFVVDFLGGEGCEDDSPTKLLARPHPNGLFPFPWVKSELTDMSLTLGIFKSNWKGIFQTIPSDDFATAFRQWMEQCKKCIQASATMSKNSMAQMFFKSQPFSSYFSLCIRFQNNLVYIAKKRQFFLFPPFKLYFFPSYNIEYLLLKRPFLLYVIWAFLYLFYPFNPIFHGPGHM
jgi:hypothetical protein